MRHRIFGKVVIAAGVVLVAEVAPAQTAGPTLRLPSPSIVPVTGPSTGPELRGAATSGLIPAAAAPAPRAVKAVHTRGGKTVVKKAPAPKRAKVVAPSTKTKQMGKAKRRAPTGQVVEGKPVSPPKRQAPTKSGTPAPTVLPRV